MTYPQDLVREAITAHAIPVQIDNSDPKNNQFLHTIHHIWTPDIRIMNTDGYEMYRWDGFLPPFEFVARLQCALDWPFCA